MGDAFSNHKIIIPPRFVNSRFDMSQDQTSNENSLMDLGLNLLNGFLDVLCDEIENGDDPERMACVLDAFLKQVQLFAEIQMQCGCDPTEALSFMREGSEDHIEEFRKVVHNNIECLSGPSAAKMVRSWAKEQFYPKADPTTTSCCKAC